jgi:ACT domain-containing protein
MQDQRDLVKSVTRAVVSRLGSAGPEVVEAVVSEVIAEVERSHGTSSPRGTIATPRGAELLPVVGKAAPDFGYCLSCVEQEKTRKRQRAVLTTTGKNSRGIVAAVTARIADLGGDILDISQTLVGDFFTMIIVIDVNALQVPFAEFQEGIQGAVRAMGCHATVMHEDVMASLHRV